MNRYKKIIVLLMVVSFSVTANAQKLTLRKANEAFYNLAYYEAVPMYLRVLEVDSNNSVAWHNVAECYRKLNDTKNTQKYLAKVVTLPDVTPLEKYYYGLSLMESERYQEAKKWLSEYQATVPDDERSNNKITGIDKLNLILQDSTNYRISNYAEVNTNSSEFGPVYFNDGVLFSSNRYVLDDLSNKYKWTGKDYYKIFYYENSNMPNPIKFNKKIQAKFNDGPTCYDKKNKLLYVTRNMVEDGKIIKASDDQIKLQIYIYKQDSTTSEWSKEIIFENNNKDYNVAQPAVSSNGNTMVFSSNMPGGFGGMDLYICKKDSGKWGAPVNLGKTINTKGNELFPFIGGDDFLVFSSNGLEGLGGLDLYYTILKDDKPTEVQHFGYPVNTLFDDFSMVLNKRLTEGYFTSNRNGGKGDDDIYNITIIKKLRPEPVIFVNIGGIVKNKKTLEPMDSVKIAITNDGTTDTLNSRAGGLFDIPYQLEYGDTIILAFLTQKDGFLKEETKITYILSDTNYSKRSKAIELLMTPVEKIIPKKLDAFEFSLYLGGIVRDKVTNAILNKVKVDIVDKKAILHTGYTDSLGHFDIPFRVMLYDTVTYSFKLEKEGYLNGDLKYTYIVSDTNEVDLNKAMKLVMTPLDAITASDLIGKDLMKIFKINPIYFDFDKYNIRKDASIELDKIVAIMKQFPNMVIEISSHTDCKGNDNYNMVLSDNRAKSTRTYIISKGIAKERLTAKGYGESKPLYNCSCEKNQPNPCTDDMRQFNRRSEFIVIKVE